MMRRRVLLVAGCLLIAGQVLSPSRVGAGPTPKCFGQDATIVRGDGDNTILGTPGRDVIVAGGGDDDVDSLQGNDLICLGLGEDTADAGPGNDKIKGQGGSDTELEGGLEGGNGTDRILGGSGNDSLYAQHDPSVKEVVVDEDENFLSGGQGADVIRSSEGNDTARGGVGGDNLDAGTGSDLLFGNNGDDRVEAFDEGGGKDLVHGGLDVDGDQCGADIEDDRIDCEILLKSS